MNFHEYQAKDLFAEYGIPVPAGFVASTPLAAVEAARELGGDMWVVKAQVHAGGRGKGGGVKFSTDRASALENIKTLIEQDQAEALQETFANANVHRGKLVETNT